MMRQARLNVKNVKKVSIWMRKDKYLVENAH